MNDIDMQIDEEWLQIVLGIYDPNDFSSEKKFKLAKWLFRTACSFFLTDPRHTHRVPEEIRKQLVEVDFIPEGFVAFFKREKLDSKELAVALIDIFVIDDDYIAPNIPRFKFGMRVNSITFGCVFFGDKKTTPSLLEFHNVFFNNIDYVIDRGDYPELFLDVAQQLNTQKNCPVAIKYLANSSICASKR